MPSLFPILEPFSPSQASSQLFRAICILPLTLTPFQPYQTLVSNLICDALDAPRPATPTPAQITRILEPRQTPQERNISTGFCGGLAPIWLRTCYLPELEPQYQDLAERAELGPARSVEPGRVLDDRTLYDFGEDWEMVLGRLPGLMDGTWWDEEGEYPEEEIEEGEDDVEQASRRVRNLVYVVDEEAVRKGLVKVKWLDEIGCAVWENWIVPECLMGFTVGLLDGLTLAKAVEGLDPRGPIAR